AVRLAVRVLGRALAFRAQGLQIIPLAVQVGIRIKMEKPHPAGKIGRETVVVAARLKTEEVEVALQVQLKYLAVEAQVTPALELIGIIYIGITQLGKAKVRPDADIVIEIFTVKNADGGFNGIQGASGVEVPEILGPAYGKTQLSNILQLILRQNRAGK